jgi:zinc transporter, ZIP family
LRRVEQRWLTAFMALTAGLLTFLGIEALFEAFEFQAAVPGALGGPGLVLLGVAGSFLTMTFLSSRFSSAGALGGVALALLVAIGIGLHNFGEGLAIGTSFAFGQLTLGSFLIVGFMIHNVTEGLGIAAPAADEGARISRSRLALLALFAGAPTIAGAWLGGFVANDVLAALFFGAAAGAALEVVVEVVRYVGRRDPAGLRSGYAVGGFLAGIAIMYATGLLAA